MSFIAWLVLGLIAGFIGSKIVNKRGEGMLLDIVLGVIGAVVGGYLFNMFGAAGVTGLNIYSLFVAVQAQSSSSSCITRYDARHERKRPACPRGRRGVCLSSTDLRFQVSNLAIAFAHTGWLMLSPALFLMACFLPALEWENEDTARSRETMIGGMALLNSFFSIMAGMPAGWANPIGLVALGLGLLGYARASLVAGLLALLALAHNRSRHRPQDAAAVYERP